MPESETAFFHNQKKPDFNPESGVIYDPVTEAEEFKRYQKLEDQSKLDVELGTKSEVKQHLMDVISLVDSIELSPLYKDDQAQKELLKKKQWQTKKLVEGVLDKIDNYLSMIRKLDEVKMDRDQMDQEDFIKELENADRARKISHNALITEVNVTNRFIARNFGDINEGMIEEWKESEEIAGRQVLYPKRVDLPKNIICIGNMDLANRKHIAGWAVQLSKSKNEIKKRLSPV